MTRPELIVAERNRFRNLVQLGRDIEMLDPQDRRLLLRLQKDSRLSNQQLAAEIGMSASACWRRVDSLEKSGVITRDSAMVDREQASFSMSAILHVALDRHDEIFVTQFVARVKKRPEVLECFATTGDADYHLRVFPNVAMSGGSLVAGERYRFSPHQPNLRYLIQSFA